MDYITKIKQSAKPVCIYGMGNGAEKIIAHLRSNGITHSCVFASDGFVRGQSFLGDRVLSFSEAKEKFGDFIIVTAFALEGDKADLFFETAKKNELYAPNLPPFGDGCIDNDFLNGRKKDIEKVRCLLADGESQKIFDSLLEYSITADINSLYFNNTPPKMPKNARIFADIGAYNGDTALEFVYENPDYEHIFAFEPEKNTFSKLVKNTSHLKNITCVNKAVWEKDCVLTFENKKGRGSGISAQGVNTEAVSLDSFFKDKPKPDRIKIDGEGADKEILKGSVNLIYGFRPSVSVAVYHRAHDIVDIPLWLNRQNGNYRFYLRNKKYIPAFDVFLYAI